MLSLQAQPNSTAKNREKIMQTPHWEQLCKQQPGES